MSGSKTRSGGRNRIPPHVHAIRGTWRADRHGAAATAVVPAPTAAMHAPAEMKVGLEVDGVAFMDAIYSEYAPTRAEGLVLRLAAQALDDAAAARQRDDVKAVRAAVRQVIAVLQRLGLPAPKVS